MSGLKVLGIDQITKRGVIYAIVTLAWFGVATNCLFEIYKMAFSSFIPAQAVAISWQIYWLYFAPIVSFCLWAALLYREYEKAAGQVSETGNGKKIKHRQGLVLAVSKPAEPSEAILQRINETQKEDVEKLFNERSIGQLFKGMYYHQEKLQHVWAITTKLSRSYLECLTRFADKFIEKKVMFHCGTPGNDYCNIKSEDELEIIEETKNIISKIYLKDNLDEHNLKISDLIVDISGGTKPITIGLIFGSLPCAIEIQYVEQRNYEIIPLKITPELILDKTGEYLLDLYAKLTEIRKKGA